MDHRGLVGSDPLGALARLGLARADALQGNSANAKTEYQDFLTLWKDADRDIPILKEAKADCAKAETVARANERRYRKFLTSIRFDSAN